MTTLHLALLASASIVGVSCTSGREETPPPECPTGMPINGCRCDPATDTMVICGADASVGLMCMPISGRYSAWRELLDACRRRVDGGVRDAGTAARDGGSSTDDGGDPDGPGPRVGELVDSPPITATAGQVIAGVRIQTTDGPCITIDVPGVIVRHSDIGPCAGEANILVSTGGVDALIEHDLIHDGNRGVLASSTSGIVTRRNRLLDFSGPAPRGTAIEYDYLSSGTIEGNEVRGSAYASDAVSVFESSDVRLVGNDIDIDVALSSAAAFTLGDALEGHEPGRDNYAARNVVHQRGGVPAGVFGSSGNTILEHNCLTAGIQAYAYNDNPFVGVVIRNNVIDLDASFVPDTTVVEGWETNIGGTDCSLVPP